MDVTDSESDTVLTLGGLSSANTPANSPTMPRVDAGAGAHKIGEIQSTQSLKEQVPSHRRKKKSLY